MTDETKVDEAVSLADQHKAFKENASTVLHEWSVGRGYCTEFDDILVTAGLLPRERNAGYYSDAARTATGEATAEEFEAWKRRATTHLLSAAEEHGIGDGVDETLREAGFNPEAFKPKKVTAVIKGTFEVELEATVADGQDLIDALAIYDIAEAVYQSLRHRRDTSTWKATVKQDNKDSDTSTTR